MLPRYFPPEIGAEATLFYELAEGMKKRGHTVKIITNFPWYNLNEVPEKYKKGLYLREELSGIEVRRLRIPTFGPKKIRMALGHITVPFTTLLAGFFAEKPDIIYAYSPPLFIGITGWLISKVKRVPFILGVQDLHPQCYIDQGVLKNAFIIRVFRALERFCYKHASLITVHSEGNKTYIAKQKVIAENKIIVVPNWVDTDKILPLPRENEFSKKYNLQNKFVVGYAGTIGMSQGLVGLIEAANLVKHEKEIKICVVGDGIDKQLMISKAKEYGLNNVSFIEMQPNVLYPLVLASFDASIVSLNSKVKTPTVPSKILSIMAAGRAIIASVPLAGDAPALINKAECGLCSEPSDLKGFSENILKLYKNRELCRKYGENGREYVLKQYSLKIALKKIEELFSSCITKKS